MSRIFFCFFIFILFAGCTKDKTEQAPPELNLTYKGVTINAAESPPHDYDLNSVHNISANAVTIVPAGIVYPGADTILFDKTGMKWGEMTDGVIEQIELAKSLELQVMIKPQITFVDGTPTNEFEAVDDSSWTKFENSYRDFILHFLTIADSLDCDLFCIGTEFGEFTTERETFWSNLISEVGTNFSGKLTYASHWDDYEDIPFWDQMDLIGINAYFPIAESQTPDVYEVKQFWEAAIIPDLESLNKQYNKPIVFTEFGYRSVDYAANEPWEQASVGNINLQAQANAYLGMFNAFDEKEWFEGSFLWQWHIGNTVPGGSDDDGYTPQNKPAEEVIAAIYGSI